ncbi:MAG: pyridoxal phosphate-dependent aminotransferase [Candidatus Latescibacteria bacterium]|jgi:aspartate/methionine/tyrosine aminotransferase|nr:pyridoxal phosphate-dependent aminotransferase [Candidatus Latescibacterota bacterium]
MNVANRMSLLGTESAFDVLVKARALEAQGHDVVHLEIGEPDFDTPSHIVEAGQKALADGFTHYGPPVGLPDLREAIAEEISSTRQIEVHPDQVVVTPGAKPIMFYSILALANEGDEVIYPNPGFPIYESVIRFVGATPVPMPLTEDRGFSWDVDLLRELVTDKTKLMIVNSPQNPTGGVIPEADLKAIAEVAVEYQIPVMADEVYSRMIYGETFHSISAYEGMADLLIILDGFSKTYAMTGWRIGFGVMPLDLVPHFNRLMVNSNSCTAAFTQMAAVAALKGPQDESEAMIAEFRKRRDFIVAGLNAIEGITCPMPVGAFYAFPNITGLGKTSSEVADLILNEGHVACLAGSDFGQYGEGYLRFSYANSVGNIQKALERIRGCAEKLLS